MGEAIRSGGAKGWRGAGLVVFVFVFVWCGSSGDRDRNLFDRLSRGVERLKKVRLHFFCRIGSSCVFHATLMGMPERSGLCLLSS